MIEIITPKCIINELLISGGEVSVIIPITTFKLIENTNPNLSCTNCVLEIGDIPNLMTMLECGTICFFYGVCFSCEVISIYLLVDLIQNHEGMLIGWICVFGGHWDDSILSNFHLHGTIKLEIFFVEVVICITNFVDWEMHMGTMGQIAFNKGQLHCNSC